MGKTQLSRASARLLEQSSSVYLAEISGFARLRPSTPAHNIGEQYEGDAAFYGAQFEVNYFESDTAPGPFVFGSVRSNDRKARWTIIGEFRS
jgi:hypothetical protein